MGKILVTGATGFVGAAVVRSLLTQGADVRITVRASSNLANIADLDAERIDADITDPAAMRRAMEGCTHLYHIAGLYRTWLPDYAMLQKVNVEGTRIVLQAARDAGIAKTVYTSSIAALGIRPDGKPSDEECQFNLQHLRIPYEESKFEAEKVAWEFSRGGLPLVVVRPAMVIGQGDIYPTPSGKMVLDVLQGKIPSYFEGGIDIVDVDDVAAGHLLAMEKGQVGQSYNLGCVGNFSTMGDIFSLIADVGGVKPPKIKVPVKAALGYAHVLEWIADHVTHKEPVAVSANIRCLAAKKAVDFSKAVRELGIPQTPLRAVIEKTVKFYRDNGYV